MPIYLLSPSTILVVEVILKLNNMIDKKIEEAKEEIYEDRFLLNGEEVVFDNDTKEEMFYKEDIKEAIGLGAKFAINEFIKDLWHAIDENPKKYHKCLVEVVYHRPLNMTDEIDYVTSHLSNFGWDESSFKRSDYAIKRWIYIDDLLKGCNHD